MSEDDHEVIPRVTGAPNATPVGWKGVTDPELRQRVEAVRTRSQQRIKDRAAGKSPAPGRWVVVDGQAVRESR